MFDSHDREGVCDLQAEEEAAAAALAEAQEGQAEEE